MTDPEEPANLKFLRRLVTGLTAVMIGGVLVIIALLVIRLSPSGPDLPQTITLPGGAEAEAFTMGADWYAVVTTDDQIMIFDKTTGKLRQTLRIERP